jgi:hypothetical protein
MKISHALRGLAVAATLAGAMTVGSVKAEHEHYIVTPGACVEDIARGQTSKGPGEGGFHRFHLNVHQGQPGTEAFANPNSPVEVGKGLCPV